jgi:hypothetical protein
MSKNLENFLSARQNSMAWGSFITLLLNSRALDQLNEGGLDHIIVERTMFALGRNAAIGDNVCVHSNVGPLVTF